jgi:Tfp pilus assembly protein PilO
MLSKREQIMAIVAVAAVGFLVLNKFLIGPVAGRLNQLETQKQQLLVEMNEAQNLFQRRRLMEKDWKAMLAEGLRNEVEAESRIARAIDGWSREAKLTLSSVKPDRAAADKGLTEITFAVAGTGSLESVAQFLWEVETTPLPIKVKDMQLGSSNESGQSMSVQLHLSAICPGTEPKPSEKKPPQQTSQENNNDV